MKKIIATVLAMVMALALCTTAFAADPVAGYTGYTRGGEKLMANATDAESFSVVAHEATFDKATGAGNVAYYTVRMLMYGKEASNRKQEIDRQHYTIPNQRPKDKHCGKI